MEFTPTGLDFAIYLPFLLFLIFMFPLILGFMKVLFRRFLLKGL